MNNQELYQQIQYKKSFLCIGLDVDLAKIPAHLLQNEDPIFEFNKQIIDATHHLAVAYKPNTAFYEAYGIKGWQALEKTINYLNSNYPEIFTIADAKRGDIGNTSTMYAKAFFEDLNFDAITVAPYMGSDSVEPFLAFKNKRTILLALTSNKGALDFQGLKTEKNEVSASLCAREQPEQQQKTMDRATCPPKLKKSVKFLVNNEIFCPGIADNDVQKRPSIDSSINQFGSVF